MIRVSAPRVLAGLMLASALVAVSWSPAVAQYRPLPTTSYATANNPVGEPYNVEFAFNLWNPEPSIVIAS